MLLYVKDSNNCWFLLVIGVLEANFVEPAHDKQGFERTTVLSRLETRLIQMQKIYWSDSFLILFKNHAWMLQGLCCFIFLFD